MTERYIEQIPSYLALPFHNALQGTALVVTIVLGVNLLFALIANNPFFGSKEKHFGVFTPVLLWIAIMGWGILMRNKAAGADAPGWPIYVLHALFYLNLPVAGFATLFANGYRYYALSVCAFLAWLSYFAYEVAMLTVMGQWG